MKVYVDENYEYGGVRVSRYKAGNVGKDHHTVRFPYTNRDATGTMLGGSGSSYYYKEIWDHFVFPNPAPLLVQNRVISKLEGKCGASGSVGSSVFAEGRESVKAAIDMLERQAAIVRAMRRKDVKALKRAWQKNRKPTAAMRSAGGKWLEFSFGWAPLVQTIFDGMKATAADFPKTKIHAVDRLIGGGVRTKTGYFTVLTKEVKQSMKVGYDVKVVNPNTWLLGRLDLLNPGVWIWEAIPYSFFVDYFINIGDMIHNLDSFAGLEFSNGYTTYYHSWDEVLLWTSTQENRGSGSGTYIRRDGPTPLRRRLVLQDNPLTSSWKRGLNASSFLAQFLR